MMTSTVAGIDPHQYSFTVDSFRNTAAGFFKPIDLLALDNGVKRVGVEGSASWVARVAITLVAVDFDAGEVPQQSSAAQRRARRLDKTDTADAGSLQERYSQNQLLVRCRRWRSMTRSSPRSRPC